MNTKNFAEIVLRGISQVFLLNNVTTGILFLIGIFYNSWAMGIGAVIGVLIGTSIALLFKYKQSDIQQGLYGYNSTLVALAIISFFGFNILSVAAASFGSILSTIVMNRMMKWRLPPYTAPFIISTWILMAVLLSLKIIPLRTSPLPIAHNIEIISAMSKGIGQVMFQENTVTGIIFFIGILVSSRISALYALLGVLLGAVVAFACSLPLNMINIGLFGFNAVLCGIAFSNKKWCSLIPGILSITASVFITYGIANLGIITLTSPFVISAWLALLLGKGITCVFTRKSGEMELHQARK